MNYGVFVPGASSDGHPTPRVGAQWNDAVVDLGLLGLEAPPGLFDRPSLNPFMAAGPDVWAAVAEQLADPAADLERAATPVERATLRLPIEVADYVDFYASIDHATNVGLLFRPDQPLMPNWRHLPVGYHGRAGTVVVSGTPVRRPHGQRLDAHGNVVFGPSTRLDFELEVGFVVGVPSVQGTPVPIEKAASHVFGVVLLNDWSARDIQAWEYQPLGPFLGKSFATSVSAWVTPLADLDGARTAPPAQSPEPLPYLQTDEPWGLDLDLTVERNGEQVSACPFAPMYWTLAQFVAHLTVNGASLRTGDLLGSGTVSGPEPGQRGCLLEMGGPFLADGDEVVLRGQAVNGVALGEVRGVVV
ncbi:MAG: fumarylacetoacetase [Acidimicrobiaceae bacterium]|nr:fumarylacetoacetase [Acidimicrobiaceae bacterium]